MHSFCVFVLYTNTLDSAYNGQPVIVTDPQKLAFIQKYSILDIRAVSLAKKTGVIREAHCIVYGCYCSSEVLRVIFALAAGDSPRLSF